MSSRQPIVMGTSVLGLKFDGGVIIAADTLGKLYMLKCIIVVNAFTGKCRIISCIGKGLLCDGYQDM